MNWRSVLLLTLGLGFCSLAPAQNPDLILTVGSTSSALGQSFDIPVTFDNTGPSDVDGWSYGVCHDPAVLMVTDAVAGSDAALVNGGNPPGFASYNVAPGVGYSVGIVVDLFGANKLAPGSGYQLSVGSYASIGTAATTTQICACSTIGTPPVATVIVIGGASLVPTQNCGNIELIELPPPSFKYIADNSTVNFDGNTGTTSATAVASLSIEEQPGTGFPNDTQGFSMDLAHDGTFLTPISVDPSTALLSLNGGMGPSFFTPTVNPQTADGVTLGVVYSLMGGQFLQFDVETVAVTVSYQIDASSLASTVSPTVTPLTWTETLGQPPVANVVVVAGASIDITPCDGSISLNPVYDLEFKRGDCNGDGIVNIADAVWTLNQLTGIGDEGTCAAACDSNDDDGVDLSDVIYTLNYRFVDGPPPPAPFPDCGIDSGADCDAYLACP